MNVFDNSTNFRVLGTDEFTRISLEYVNNKSVRNEIMARLDLLGVPYRIMRQGPSRDNSDVGYMIVDVYGRNVLELEFGEESMTESQKEELVEEVPTKEEKVAAKKKATKKKKPTLKSVD